MEYLFFISWIFDNILIFGRYIKFFDSGSFERILVYYCIVDLGIVWKNFLYIGGFCGMLRWKMVYKFYG